MGTNTGKFREMSENFVSPEKWEHDNTVKTLLRSFTMLNLRNMY